MREIVPPAVPLSSPDPANPSPSSSLPAAAVRDPGATSARGAAATSTAAAATAVRSSWSSASGSSTSSDTRTRRWLPLLGIFLVSLNLRAAVTSLSAIYGDIGKDVHGLNISLLGTLPLLSFALFGSATSTLAKRLGFERSLCISMLLIAAGIGLRSISQAFPVFAVCTVLALAGIGFSNVLMPPVIKQYFPDHVGGMTAFYAVMIAVSAGLPSAIAVPITDAIGWRANVGLWAVTAAIAILPWLALSVSKRWNEKQGEKLGEPQGKQLTKAPGAKPGGIRDKRLSNRIGREQPAGQDSVASAAAPLQRSGVPLSHKPVYRWPLAWSMVILFGVTMMSMYAMLTWLPVYLIAHGMSKAAAGDVLFVYNIVGIVHSILVPMFLDKMRRPYLVVALGGGLQIVGYMGFLFVPCGAWVWAVVAAPGLIGIPATFDLINLRTRTSAGASSLSTFVQAAGYVLAAIGPFVTGKLAASAGGWDAAFGFLSAMAVVMLIAARGAVANRFLEDA